MQPSGQSGTVRPQSAAAANYRRGRDSGSGGGGGDAMNAPIYASDQFRIAAFKVTRGWPPDAGTAGIRARHGARALSALSTAAPTTFLAGAAVQQPRGARLVGTGQGTGTGNIQLHVPAMVEDHVSPHSSNYHPSPRTARATTGKRALLLTPVRLGKCMGGE